MESSIPDSLSQCTSTLKYTAILVLAKKNYSGSKPQTRVVSLSGENLISARISQSNTQHITQNTLDCKVPHLPDDEDDYYMDGEDEDDDDDEDDEDEDEKRRRRRRKKKWKKKWQWR